MIPFTGGLPHCKNCGVEIEGSEEQCPGCGYSPRQLGMKVATVALIGAVTSFALAFITLVLSPTAGSYLLSGAIVLFLLATVIFFLSLIATPYRLGGVFVRF